MRWGGSANLRARKDARTRSRLSPTALSASPTMAKASWPGATRTWTSTGRTSMPWNATVLTLACMRLVLSLPEGRNGTGGRYTSVLLHQRMMAGGELAVGDLAQLGHHVRTNLVGARAACPEAATRGRRDGRGRLADRAIGRGLHRPIG